MVIVYARRYLASLPSCGLFNIEATQSVWSDKWINTMLLTI